MEKSFIILNESKTLIKWNDKCPEGNVELHIWNSLQWKTHKQSDTEVIDIFKQMSNILIKSLVFSKCGFSVRKGQKNWKNNKKIQKKTENQIHLKQSYIDTNFC